MENKINIAEILKSCPQGMELDCAMYDDLYFNQIYDDDSCLYKIGCYTIVDGIRTTVNFTEFGTFNTHINSKCVIFPKDKTTWEGFAPPIEFKEGEIIYTLLEGDLEFISIFKKADKTLIYTYVALSSTLYRGDMNGLCKKTDIVLQRLATEEEMQKLFDAIKDNGYRWNAEKKTLEELIKPIFKKGDKVRVKNGLSEYRVIDNVEDTFYSLVPIGKIDFTDQNRWELVPNKFDINTLVPFESRVLVRDNKTEAWKPAYWGFYDETNIMSFPYETVGGNCFSMCIPYEGNEHLIGKTDDCNDFYKNWK